LTLNTRAHYLGILLLHYMQQQASGASTLCRTEIISITTS